MSEKGSTLSMLAGNDCGTMVKKEQACGKEEIMNGGSSMYITITTSQPTSEQLPEEEAFLHQFLPRLQQQPGVVAVYHFFRPDKGDDSTLIIWENEAAVQAYRTSALVKEAIAFGQAHNLPATREGYPLMFPR